VAARRCGSSSSQARSSGFPQLKYVVTESAAYWAADMLWKWDTTSVAGTPRRSWPRSSWQSAVCRASTSATTSSSARRRCRAKVRPVRHRRRDAHVGQRLPPPGGHLAQHGREAQGDVPRRAVEDATKMLARSRRPCTTSSVATLRKLADEIGPTPEDLGQDAALAVDRDAVTAARWWRKASSRQARALSNGWRRGRAPTSRREVLDAARRMVRERRRGCR